MAEVYQEVQLPGTRKILQVATGSRVVRVCVCVCVPLSSLSFELRVVRRTTEIRSPFGYRCLPRSSAISESKKPAWMSPQEAKVAPASAEATKWRPYENCRNGCPLLSLMPPVVDPVTELWWAARWRAAWPLHRRVPGTCWTFGEAMFLPIICCAAVVFGARMWGDVERSGYPATFLGALTYATACRNSILTLLTGVPFERAIFYHKCIAVLAILAACYHGYVALSFPVDVSHAAIGTEQFTWSVLGEGRNWSGIAIFACWVSATLVALVWIRRYLVEIFNRLHIVAAMVGLVFAAQHGAMTTLAGGALWALDKVLSLLFSLAKMNKAQTHKAMARVLPADLVEISFPRGSFKYKGGQWCNVWVPNLGLQWHPFSLSSSPHDPEAGADFFDGLATARWRCSSVVSCFFLVERT